MKAWPAPAKLNLFLHIVGRRADGYHALQTVFRFIDHGDSLYFSVREDDAVVLETPLPGVPPEQDLALRLMPAACCSRRAAPASASRSVCPWAAAWVAAVLMPPLPWSRSITSGRRG